MQSLNAAAIAALDAGSIVLRGIIEVDLASGTIGFWDDAFDHTIDGQLYLGGRLKQIAPQTGGADLTIVGASVTLSGFVDATPPTALIDEYDQRPVRVSILIIDTVTLVVAQKLRWFTGKIDEISYSEQADGECSITVQIESSARDLTHAPLRVRSDPDQKLIDATDQFFQYTAASITEPVYWGKLPPTIAGSGSKLFGAA